MSVNASTDYRLSVAVYPDTLYDPVYLEVTVPYDNTSTVFSICRVELVSVGSNLPCVNQSSINASVTYYSTYVRLVLHYFRPSVRLSASHCLSVRVSVCLSVLLFVFLYPTWNSLELANYAVHGTQCNGSDVRLSVCSSHAVRCLSVCLSGYWR